MVTNDKKLLNGKRILIIRSKRDDDPLDTLLEGAGAQLIKIPVMKITEDEETHHIRDEVLSLDAFDLVIFVSRFAALLGAHHMRHYWPKPPLGVQFFCVGETTANILQAEGYSSLYPEREQTSEGLLAMSALKDVEGKNILIFRGIGGRELLGEELARRGAIVDYCDLYRRTINEKNIPRARAALADVDYLVAHSGELLQAMGQVENTSSGKPVVVPSSRVAAIADQLGYRKVFTAAGALAEPMFETLLASARDCQS